MIQINKPLLRVPIFLLVSLLVFSQVTLALGVSPARTIIHVGTDDQVFSFRPIPSPSETGMISVRLSGDLAPYATLNAVRLQGPDSLVDGSLSLPNDLSPGDHILEVVFSHTNPSLGTVSASAEVAGQVLVKVPYPDEYLVASWDVRPSDQALSITATVTVENLGNVPVLPDVMLILLRDEEQVVDSLSLQPAFIPQGSFVKFQGSSESISSPGEYEAFLHIDYGEKRFSDARAVVIGKPRVVLSRVVASPEPNGQILPIDVRGTIVWNKPLLVTFEVVKDGILIHEENDVLLNDAFAHRLYVESPGEFSSPLSITMRFPGGQTMVLVPSPVDRSSLSSSWHLWVFSVGIIVLLGFVIVWRARKK